MPSSATSSTFTKTSPPTYTAFPANNNTNTNSKPASNGKSSWLANVLNNESSSSSSSASESKPFPLNNNNVKPFQQQHQQQLTGQTKTTTFERLPSLKATSNNNGSYGYGSAAITPTSAQSSINSGEFEPCSTATSATSHCFGGSNSATAPGFSSVGHTGGFFKSDSEGKVKLPALTELGL
ncbi:unnamed protein product [Ambrosiozyma monospora]|uniref:Unnamed protein product n=1 Tax=Ambrosiozyma monospora TaxID=43982 RepID=A0ACB5TAB3_AMBMO|nr:unnamed protein product [Ambrosiozyma monospora]